MEYLLFYVLVFVLVVVPILAILKSTDGLKHVSRWPDDPNAGDIGEP